MNAPARCRGCGKPILWARHASSGKPAPFDHEPSDAGTYDLRPTFAGDGLMAVYDPQAEPRYVPHHATCEQVGMFR
jgi:hypothetical protein